MEENKNNRTAVGLTMGATIVALCALFAFAIHAVPLSLPSKNWKPTPPEDIRTVSSVNSDDNVVTAATFGTQEGGFSFAGRDMVTSEGIYRNDHVKNTTDRTVDVYVNMADSDNIRFLEKAVPYFSERMGTRHLVVSIHPVVDDDKNAEIVARGMAAFGSANSTYLWAFFADTVNYLESEVPPTSEIELKKEMEKISGNWANLDHLDFDSDRADELVKQAKKINNEKIDGLTPTIFVDGQRINNDRFNIYDTGTLDAAIYGVFVGPEDEERNN